MKRVIIAFLCFNLFACATPSQRFNDTALALGFNSQILSSKQFQHKIYQTDKLMAGDVLHVYLDGDGTPWIRNRWVAEDPTARNSLILRLMEQDAAPSILLGRPCYYGFSRNEECYSKYWTSHRYSIEVVDSLVTVLNAWLDLHAFKHVILIGYSGGGSLAVLIAEKINGVKKVVTVAANLNVAAWSAHHGYSTLRGSLNPSDQVGALSTIKQIHFAGQDDEVVPAFIIKNFVDKQKNARYFELPNNDHTCCWVEEWANILNIVEAKNN